MKQITKLNSSTIPLENGIDPPAHRINPDYLQQPSNSRQCTECNKWHDTIVENTMTGERIEELHKCKDCIMSKCFFYPITEQVHLNETDYKDK